MRLFRVLLLCAIFALLLLGCAALPITERARAQNLLDSLQRYYTTEAVITTSTAQVRVRIHHPDPLTTRVELLSPESVAGFVYSFSEAGVELSFAGLSFNADPFSGRGSIPALSTATALSALLLPEQERELPRLQNGLWVLQGNMATLFLDEESGLPVKLLLHGSEVEIIFEYFVFLV